MHLLSQQNYAFPLTVKDRLKLLGTAGLRALPWSVLRLVGTRTNSDGETLDPDVLASLRGLSLVSQDYSDLPVEEARAVIDADSIMGAGPQIPVGSVADITVAGVPARYYRPAGVGEEKLPLLIYFHGGGWVVGSLTSHDNTARYFCAQGKVAVLLVDYPMAPEHPFPAALHAAIAVTEAAMRGDVEGADPQQVAVAGDSAGGNLSAAVCLALAQKNAPQPQLQMLFVPATDMRDHTTASFQEFATGYYLTAKQMFWFRTLYVPEEEDCANPLISPLAASDELLARVAPAYVSVAGHDPLRDDGEAYARRLKAVGVPTTLRRNSTLIHPFVNSFWAWKGAQRAMDEAVGALRLTFGIMG